MFGVVISMGPWFWSLDGLGLRVLRCRDSYLWLPSAVLQGFVTDCSCAYLGLPIVSAEFPVLGVTIYDPSHKTG